MGCCGWTGDSRPGSVATQAGRPPLEVVEERLAAAEAALDAATGGTPVCRVGADRLRPVKHQEGRAAALAEVRRALRRLEASPDGEPACDAEVALVRTTADEWAAKAELATARGPGWLAYLRGGADELDTLARDLAR